MQKAISGKPGKLFSASPFGSLSAQFYTGLKLLSFCCTRAEMDNTVFLKYAKCQTKHNDFFILGSRRKEFKIKISQYQIAKAHIQYKLSENQIEFNKVNRLNTSSRLQIKNFIYLPTLQTCCVGQILLIFRAKS